ncbi:MAG: hypothetical protein ACLUUO_20265 [Sellimonas intestinalis]
MIVCDYFHWPQQGDWKFDKAYWPDPAAMSKRTYRDGNPSFSFYLANSGSKK